MKNGIPSDFPVDVDRFLMSEAVGCMEAEQVGAYWLLLLYAWSQPDCTIPADDARLAKLSRLGKRWAKAGAAVRACFEAVPGKPDRLWNRLQVQTREEQKARMERSAEKCEKMRQAKAKKQDPQMKFDDLPEAPSKGLAPASYKEPSKEASEASFKESLAEPLQALSVPYSYSLPIPKGGGSPLTEAVSGPEDGAPPPPASAPAVGSGPFRPVPGPEPLFAEGGYPSSFKSRIAAAEAVVARIRADHGNYDFGLMDAARDAIAHNRKEQRPGWEDRVKRLETAPEYRTRTPKPETASVLAQWKARLEELKTAASGAVMAA
jgi:uncharacterized protein YdaU (DUF1376 family)